MQIMITISITVKALYHILSFLIVRVPLSLHVSEVYDMACLLGVTYTQYGISRK